MSHDQRPGRVRVFSSGDPADTPQRRRGDPKPLPTLTPDTLPESLSPIEEAPRRSMLGPALLFLAGCVVASGLATYFDLAGMIGR